MAWFKKTPSQKAPLATDSAEVASDTVDPVDPVDTVETVETVDTADTADTTDTTDTSGPTPAAESPTRSSASIMSTMNEQLLNKANTLNAGDTDALNSQIVQAVEFTNAQTFSYAPAQIAIAPDMMISQAAGLVAQSAAGYFDGVSKLALAAQAVLLKQMTENIVKENMAGAAEDALGALATDLLVGAAAAVAAAAGAIEAEAAGMAIDKIDESIAKYSATLANRAAS